jgi:hypothetical protein
MTDRTPTCATSVNEPERASADGPSLPPTELRSSLVEALRELGQALVLQASAMDRQNELLAQIVAQNADLISALIDEEDEDDEGERDLMGNPVR